MVGKQFLEYEIQTVDVDGHRISVIDQRQNRTGPPVVFIHGILMSVGFWPRVIQGTPLDNYRWISVGLPGHYPGSVPKDYRRHDFTESLFSNCLKKVIDQFFVDESAHLVGWSTGGFAALVTAADFPETVRSVISLNGFVRGRWTSLFGFLQWLSRIRLTSWMVPLGMKLVAASPRLYRLFQWMITVKRITPDEFLTRIFACSYQDYQRHEMRIMRDLFAELRQIDATEKLTKITAPVLVLGGAKDPVIPPDEADYLHENLMHSTLIQQTDLGHLFFMEGLQQTLSHIDDWITQ